MFWDKKRCLFGVLIMWVAFYRRGLCLAKASVRLHLVIVEGVI